MHRLFPSLLLLAACAANPANREAREAGDDSVPGDFSSVVGDTPRQAGLFDSYVNAETAQAWIALPATGPDGLLAEVLYIEALASGLGSNPLGLDRGKIGGEAIVQFRRVGGRVLLERPNLGFRAESQDAEERRAVAESFARSVLWATDIAAESGEQILIEITPWIVRDAHGVARSLDGDGWQLDSERSLLLTDAALVFRDNLEFEALLTFQSQRPGREVRGTAPDSRAVTLVQHHSFVRLPPDGFEPRRFDPRMGAISIGWQDYAAPLSAPLEVRYAVRHRLEKTQPAELTSTVVEPIVYYVDPGAPEPVRSALIEGASWWGDAFRAAGFLDAFRVEVLPEGAHPLDVRYNVIQWVHRSTRGWSYGNSVVDPRTGEILKGHVSLGSLRVRQDRLLFEGLLGATGTDSGAPDDPIELSLARLRQLSAHEVGHTLGFVHNFAASTQDRASVMDYPAPLIAVTEDGELDVSRAYAIGIGSWDVHTVRMLYGEPLAGSSVLSYLRPLLNAVGGDGFRFLTDSDARAPGASHPAASLWDNFADPVEGLENALAVRQVALESFGLSAIARDTPLGQLQEVLVPVYLHHRFQVDAAAKLVGGVDYDHLVKWRGVEVPTRPVPGAQQTRALAALFACLDPEQLDLSERVLALLAPRAPGRSRGERFESQTAPAFDALGAASSAAELVVANLLQRERAARLVDQHRRDPSLPGLEDVTASLVAAAFGGPADEPRRTELLRVVQDAVLSGLERLAEDARAPARVRERAEAELALLRVRLSAGDPLNPTLLRLERFLGRAHPPASVAPPAPEAPPGSPIGAAEACGVGG